MSVSDIVGEIARVTEAFEKPTLRLLDGKWAAFRVAVFRAAFSRDRRSVPADRRGDWNAIGRSGSLAPGPLAMERQLDAQPRIGASRRPSQAGELLL